MSQFFASPVRDASAALRDYFVPANAPFSCVVKKGESVRIVDLEGQQAVDTLFYKADDFSERYSSQDTLRVQGSAYVSTGTFMKKLMLGTMSRFVMPCLATSITKFSRQACRYFT